jgi:predicted lipoprotein with Yx(FWY)xxD motif
LKEWTPVLAPATAEELGEWTTVEASPGIKQWAFRGKPLYTYNLDPRTRSVLGSDVPGWHNVYMQRALPPPNDFTVQDSRLGQVLADARGRTIYLYNCSDDAVDQLACDHPETPQEYRMAICGNGDPKLCGKTFPYVTAAAANARSDSKLWSVMAIDPNTGRRAAAGAAGAISVWAYRDRPVYTYGDDREPGDADGDAYGEFNGFRNGYKAFWLRDDFRNNALVR